jgi:cell division GTPase FtsZ
MSDLLKNVIQNLNVDNTDNLFDTSKESTPTLDDFDDLQNFANFKIKVFGVGGAGCNVIDYMLTKRN